MDVIYLKYYLVDAPSQVRLVATLCFKVGQERNNWFGCQKNSFFAFNCKSKSEYINILGHYFSLSVFIAPNSASAI